MASKLAVRLAAPLVAVSLLLLMVGVGAAWHVHRVQRTVSKGLLDNVSGMRAAEELEILTWQIRTQLDHFLITGEVQYLEASAAFRRDADYWLTQAERYSLTPYEEQLTGRARRGYERLLKKLDTLPAKLPPEKLKLRVRRLIDEVLERELLQPTHEYLDFNEEEVEQAVAESQTMSNWLIFGLLSLGICGCGAGLVAGFGITRGIQRSLIQLSVPIRAAAGQLDEVVGPITVNTAADLHQLEGVLHAIAERIGEVVERLRQSEREALRAEQMAAVGQMAAGMAHELRNPLTSMKLLVQAAQARDGSGLGGRDLRVLEEEIARLEGLIQSFLQFARPPRLEKREVELRALVEETVRLVEVRAGQCGARVECRLPEGPVRAAVDPGQFRQVLLNLLLNALDAVAAAGERSVGRLAGTVEVVLEVEASGWLRLEVSDNGCGLPPELGSRIFAPFVTNKETGLGLGLSICKRIVEVHAGTLDGANRPGGGAVFTVRLPPFKMTNDQGRGNDT
jgi:signal transduction histidine kinase